LTPRRDAASRVLAPRRGKPRLYSETKVLRRAFTLDRKWRERLTIQNMERKIFWVSFTVLGLLADFVLPIWWALGATIPIGYASWWLAYRSGWFE